MTVRLKVSEVYSDTEDEEDSHIGSGMSRRNECSVKEGESNINPADHEFHMPAEYYLI